jgi:hypothetical protein
MAKYGRWIREIDYCLEMRQPYPSLNLDVGIKNGQQQTFLDVFRNMGLLASSYGMSMPIC